MIPKEKMVEIAKAVFNTLTIEDIKVLLNTLISIIMNIYWVSALPDFCVFIIIKHFLQLFASSLLPHVTQKFSVEQLIEIGLPLAWVHYHNHHLHPNMFSSSSQH